MGALDKAVDIAQMEQRNLWVLYGKSGSGKTHAASTFPKPLLYIQIGDDGANTIKNVKGIKILRPSTLAELKSIAIELMTDKKYATVVCDTFSMVVNEWINANAVQKSKRMSQQAWGDLMTDTQEFIRMWHMISLNKIVVLTCHEVTDSFEGFEDEIAPDIRPNVSKGARTYLEGMSNFGVHMVVVSREVEQPDGSTKTIIKHAAQIAPNPYYWVKTQKPAEVKLPNLVINPTYDKIMGLIQAPK